MSVYGYARTSTTDQHVDRQLAAFEAEGIASENIFVDQASGKDFNRGAYKELVGTPDSPGALQEGDVLVFLSLDRMGRDYAEIQNQWRFITKDIGADIKIIDMPLLNTTVCGESLDRTFIADLTLQILSYVAAKERALINERIRAGVAVARERGVYDKANHKGKKRQIVDARKFEAAYQDYYHSRASIDELAARLGLSSHQLRRRFKEREAVGTDYNPNAIPA